jgi:DNA-binding CsgD family transcriptional regulator
VQQFRFPNCSLIKNVCNTISAEFLQGKISQEIAAGKISQEIAADLDKIVLRL